MATGKYVVARDVVSRVYWSFPVVWESRQRREDLARFVVSALDRGATSFDVRDYDAYHDRTYVLVAYPEGYTNSHDVGRHVVYTECWNS